MQRVVVISGPGMPKAPPGWTCVSYTTKTSDSGGPPVFATVLCVPKEVIQLPTEAPVIKVDAPKSYQGMLDWYEDACWREERKRQCPWLGKRIDYQQRRGQHWTGRRPHLSNFHYCK